MGPCFKSSLWPWATLATLGCNSHSRMEGRVLTTGRWGLSNPIITYRKHKSDTRVSSEETILVFLVNAVLAPFTSARFLRPRLLYFYGTGFWADPQLVSVNWNLGSPGGRILLRLWIHRCSGHGGSPSARPGTEQPLLGGSSGRFRRPHRRPGYFLFLERIFCKGFGPAFPHSFGRRVEERRTVGLGPVAKIFIYGHRRIHHRLPAPDGNRRGHSILKPKDVHPQVCVDRFWTAHPWNFYNPGNWETDLKPGSGCLPQRLKRQKSALGPRSCQRTAKPGDYLFLIQLRKL